MSKADHASNFVYTTFDDTVGDFRKYVENTLQKDILVPRMSTFKMADGKINTSAGNCGIGGLYFVTNDMLRVDRVPIYVWIYWVSEGWCRVG